VRVPDYVSVDTLQRVLDIDRDVLREFNPALRPSIWRGAKYVPRGYELRIPASAPRDEMLAALSQINEDERYGSQLRDRYYKVRRGNTLDGIARHFEVDIDDLVAINGLKSRHRIRAGQVLALPLPDGVTVDASAPVPSEALAAIRPEPTLVAENGRYTVRRGDSVWLIARRLGVDEGTLVSLNDLGDGERIHVGQVLRVEPEKPEPVVVAALSAQTGAAADVEDTGVIPATAPTPSIAADEPARLHLDSGLVEAPAAAIATADAQTPLPEPAAADVEAVPPAHVSDGLIARVEQAEPVSAEEAEEIAPALPLTVQPDLSADPSDYSVVANDSIEVQAAETLGHYADWLELRAWRLRHLNGMRYGQPVVIGQRLSLDFSRVSATDFEHRRIAYHQALQDSFFKRYRIAGTGTHVIRRGESLWILARRTYEVPIWLLRQYNPDLDFDSVDIGVTVTVPQLEPLQDGTPVARTTTAKVH
jgi:membrane-bound lytic murein transglycosylase D